MQRPTIPANRRPPRQLRGVTPVDLTAYLASGLVLGFGLLPGFGLFGTSAPDASSPAGGLASHLEYAQRTAIEQSRTITVCPSTDGQHCADEPAWREGWLIYADTQGVRGQRDPGDELLQRQAGAAGPAQLEIDARYISYLPDGDMELE